MKFLSILALGVALMSSSFLSAAEPAQTNCHCVECQCTPDNHCGCFSAEGCHCDDKTSCSGGSKIACKGTKCPCPGKR